LMLLIKRIKEPQFHQIENRRIHLEAFPPKTSITKL
jgi:hypothetical protein